MGSVRFKPHIFTRLGLSIEFPVSAHLFALNLHCLGFGKFLLGLISILSDPIISWTVRSFLLNVPFNRKLGGNVFLISGRMDWALLID